MNIVSDSFFIQSEPFSRKKLDKLIIMSATIDLNFFIDYFVKGNIKPNVISIEGRTGVVDRFFLDDIFAQIPECEQHIRGLSLGFVKIYGLLMFNL